MTGAEKERAERIRRYEEAYVAANGDAVRCTYNGRRYRVGLSCMTGQQLDRATERLEQRAKESGQ